MAAILREVLTSAGMQLTLFTGGGNSYAGVRLAGTWVGTVSFFASTDGATFRPVNLTPFPTGTEVKTATANGNFQIALTNLAALRVEFTSRTSGSLQVQMASSLDASFQDAFLTPSDRYATQTSTANAANTITIAAQANRAWRLRTLVVTFSGGTPTTANVQVSDGASSLIWDVDLPLAAGVNNVPLPADPGYPGEDRGGLVGTPGNSLVITVAAAGGGIVSRINAEVLAA